MRHGQKEKTKESKNQGMEESQSEGMEAGENPQSTC